VASECSACWCIRMGASEYAKRRRRTFFIPEFAVLWLPKQLQRNRRPFNDFPITKYSHITLLILHAHRRTDQERKNAWYILSVSPARYQYASFSPSEVRFLVCVHVMLFFFYLFLNLTWKHSFLSPQSTF
jgi:hypothetical protein